MTKKQGYYRFPIAEDTEGSRLKRLRLNVLVHSCIYYELGSSIISDALFDTWCKELVDLSGWIPPRCSDRFGAAFKDWTGETGYHLPLHDPWVLGKAQYLLETFGAD